MKKIIFTIFYVIISLIAIASGYMFFYRQSLRGGIILCITSFAIGVINLQRQMIEYKRAKWHEDGQRKGSAQFRLSKTIPALIGSIGVAVYLFFNWKIMNP